jgi:2',3'-cyclic-nucleotide 2'-phosphodiesterase (5'-nucleotidase family)
MRTEILGMGILLLILLFPMVNHLSLATEASFTLIYTSNTLGELEPCSTCPEGGDNGGLPRRAHYLKTVKEEVKNLLILDGGDALVMSYYGQPSEREKARRWAEFVLKLYETLGYQALNIGDTDLGLGVEYLKNLQKNSKILFLSANLKDKKTNKPIFKPYLIKEIGGIKIGILGLITNEISPNIQKELKNYSIENPTKVAKENTHRFMASCDHIIALAHLTPPEIESLAKEVPRLSIIIGGNDRSFIFPKQIHRSIYVQTDAFGAHIGRMNLNLIKGSSEFIDISPKNLIQRKIDEIQKKIEDPKYEKDIKALKNLQTILIEQKKKMPSSEGKNTYENYLILMNPKMESDKDIENLIESSKDRLKRPIPY